MEGPFLAIDWGTTNRRVYRIEKGLVTQKIQDARGILSLKKRDYEGELTAIRQALGDYPLLMAGMVGAAIGWQEVPYVEAPANLDIFAHSLTYLDERTAIVPGMTCDYQGRVDVMRGEEVQFLGAMQNNLTNSIDIMCQPGTHNKWAWPCPNGTITHFITAMTGEMFALLKNHSLLAGLLEGDVEDGPAFRKGLEESHNADLLSQIFNIRAQLLRKKLNPDQAAAYTSGLLIGSDVSARSVKDQKVLLLADGILEKLYTVAISEKGGQLIQYKSEQAFVSGITKIWELAHNDPH